MNKVVIITLSCCVKIILGFFSSTDITHVVGSQSLNVQASVSIYSLNQYCTPNMQDVAPIINRLLQQGDVYIPSGKWKLSSKIILPSCRKIFGEGKNKTILYAEEPLRMIEVVGDDNEIKDIYFQGSNITEKASYLIYKLRETKKLIIENCSFEGATGGIFIDAICDSIYICGCDFYKMYPCKQQSSSGYGIVFNHYDKKHERGTFYGTIEKNIFHETVFRHSIYLQSSENIEVKNNVFYALNEEKPTTYEFQVNIRGCRNLLFEGNVSKGGYGFINGTSSKYHGRGSDFLIRNNVFIDNISSNNNLGVINVKFHNVTIQDNTFLNYKTIGVYIANVSGTIIENNRFESRLADLYPVIDMSRKNIEGMSIKNNIISREGVALSPAINVMHSKISYLCISDNIFTGDKTGIRIEESQMDSLIISDNYHHGELCNDMNDNRIVKYVKYTNNRAKRHPSIITSRKAEVQIKNNRF